MNKKIIISLVLIASSAVNLVSSEKIKHTPAHAFKQEGMSIAHDLMMSVNKLQQDLWRAKTSLESQPGNKKMARMALHNLMKLLDMVLSQVVNFSKFFIADDAESKVKKSSKNDPRHKKMNKNVSILAEADENHESIEDGLAAPLLSETLRKKEKAEKKANDLLGAVKSIQSKVDLLEQEVKEKNKIIAKLENDKKNKKNDLVLKYTKGIGLEYSAWRDRALGCIEKDDVKSLARLLSSANTDIVKEAMVNGDILTSLRSCMIVTAATQRISESNSLNEPDLLTRKALFMYDYINLWVKPAYDGRNTKCLDYLQKKDPFGINNFFCVKQNIGRYRTYEPAIILSLENQIQCWKDTQEITKLVTNILNSGYAY